MRCGENLKNLRGDETQDNIAKAVGVSKSAWAMYERNERILRDEVKVRIANYFNKSVQEIFFEPMSTNSVRRKNQQTT